MMKDRKTAIGAGLVVLALVLSSLVMFAWLPFGDKESPVIEPEPPERGIAQTGDPANDVDVDVGDIRDSRSDVVTLTEFSAAVRDRQFDLVRTGLGSAVEATIDQPALERARYEISPSSREFELYVFPSEKIARAAVSEFADTELVENGGAVARGANLVAAFPERPTEFRGYRVIERVLAELSTSEARRGG